MAILSAVDQCALALISWEELNFWNPSIQDSPCSAVLLENKLSREGHFYKEIRRARGREDELDLQEVEQPRQVSSIPF